ncbi:MULTISPECIES: BufA2 family periplasmic bufferin-type metallophore [Methylosinus]|uniref:DUF2282 domain-containing protein n=1 Tax=Methylosinus sporium TaxID=428 RepID=A0A2U1SNA7_METSR|nr:MULTISPECIES: hypothetical protein [Methylosinus]MBU3890202.1 hypothetical protein [Methylosinus sp. KRF6]PWB93090.1 hypothetical protein C5689_15075 [Methylosinus sporium]TRL38273.1 hypothetical protein FM996_00790 [Methylosinus sporium]
MKTNIVSGVSIAAAAVALAVSGAAVAPALAKKAPVHCAGINSCKGESACKTASSACKGQNSCKGQGWLPAKSAKACKAKGGTVAEM